MSIRNHMSRLTEGILDQNGVIKPGATDGEKRSGALTAPGALAHFSKDYQNLESELAKAKASLGVPALLDVSAIVSSPYQTRSIDELRITELMANLAHNALSTPVTVRKLSDAPAYELIAGHHRLEAFKRLGRAEIPGSIISANDAQAERLVFYDNLIAPQLNDYEKYLGFAQLKKSQNLTLEHMAIESGLSTPMIGFIMSYERLPANVLTAISKHPGAVKGILIQKLAALPSNYNDRIIESIGKIADGSLLPVHAIRWILDKTKTQTKPKVTLIRSGRFKFADVSRKDGHLSIKFTNTEDAQFLEDALIDLVKKHATNHSKSKLSAPGEKFEE